MPMPLKMCGSVSARLSVWFSPCQPRGEAGEVGVEHLEAARIERVDRGLAADDVQRRLALRARPR